MDDELQEMNADLAAAIELLHAGLLLRMHGDIDNMPMAQAEWDHKTEEFLRSMSDGN